MGMHQTPERHGCETKLPWSAGSRGTSGNEFRRSGMGPGRLGGVYWRVGQRQNVVRLCNGAPPWAPAHVTTEHLRTCPPVAHDERHNNLGQRYHEQGETTIYVPSTRASTRASRNKRSTTSACPYKSATRSACWSCAPGSTRSSRSRRSTTATCPLRQAHSSALEL